MVKMPSLDDLAQGDKVGYPKMEVSIHLGSEAQHRPPRAPGTYMMHIQTCRPNTSTQKVKVWEISISLFSVVKGIF